MIIKFKSILLEIDEKDYPIHGWVQKHGIPIEIENKKHTIRTGYDKRNPMGGSNWITKFTNHYGRIPGTSAKDGDALDIFLGDDINADKVYIVKQLKFGSKEFDELKIMIGFKDKQAAKICYFKHNNKASELYGGIISMDIPRFKKFIIRNIKNTKNKNND